LAFSAVFIFTAELTPSAHQSQYAVITPLWYSFAETVEAVNRAGGALVATGRFENVVIAESKDPEFLRKLYGAGVWWVVNPLQLHGCLGNSRTREQS
jgi:hypothetical protein